MAEAKQQHDAVKFLTAEHKEVKRLFEQYEKLVSAGAKAIEREALARQICLMLTVHSATEEEIFYPAARKVLDETDLLDEADVEHASAKELIAQIESAKPTDAHYDAKVRVLGEYVAHHVKEEEGELFPTVKRAGLDLNALGEAIAARKDELLGVSAAVH